MNRLVQEWNDEFITKAQHELKGMVSDLKYEYGVSDHECSAMLLWMLIKLNPDANIGTGLIDR